MRPGSFDAALAEQWSRWVLAHGLPELPGRDLPLGRSVPVGCWVGPDTAAVAHVRYLRWDDDEEPFPQVDVELFCLVDGEWEIWGGGGGNWTDEPTLDRVAVPPGTAALDGMTAGWADDRGCTALFGPVGTDAATVEVTQEGRATRRPVEAPVGLLVVCADSRYPFTVRVLDAAGGLLGEVDQPAGRDGVTPG
ncbi:hypothetical protein DQ237_15725 [Blastococcus sp. TF02-8]|uniref:hypothetical protein n=1 Tax=Blastococcus sp. TF02-8 TaxID=2250574 RepID=UPI000DEBAE48|nr:hypothetical protein [Blastococcus sp. TF02-8]RBY95141.1 hypothetical protein DQ237_15725 [Blastococcus sp. TF02-8]